MQPSPKMLFFSHIFCNFKAGMPFHYIYSIDTIISTKVFRTRDCVSLQYSAIQVSKRFVHRRSSFETKVYGYRRLAWPRVRRTQTHIPFNAIVSYFPIRFYVINTVFNVFIILYYIYTQ